MNNTQLTIIRENYVTLQDKLVVNEQFLGHFFRNRILNDNQIEEVLGMGNRFAKAREFLIVIQRRGSYAWDVWYNALVATFQYELADILKPELAPSRNHGFQMQQVTEYPNPSGEDSPSSAMSSGSSGPPSDQGGGGGYRRGYGHGGGYGLGGGGSGHAQGGLQAHGHAQNRNQPGQVGVGHFPAQGGNAMGNRVGEVLFHAVQPSSAVVNERGSNMQGVYGQGGPLHDARFGQHDQPDYVQHRMCDLQGGMDSYQTGTHHEPPGESRSLQSMPMPANHSNHNTNIDLPAQRSHAQCDQHNRGNLSLAGSQQPPPAQDNRHSFTSGRHLETPDESLSLDPILSSHLDPNQTSPVQQRYPDHLSDNLTDFSDDEDPPFLNGRNSNLYYMEPEVRKTMRPQIVEMLVRNNKKVYRMTNKPRGRALIINNEYFDQILNPTKTGQKILLHRNGSQIDRRNLNNFFPKFDIEPVIHDNVRSEDFLGLIEKETKQPVHERSDLFVLVIMSHGDKDIVYGADGVPVKLLDVYDKLSAQNFAAMAHKPKIVLIQACAGGRSDSGCQIFRMETDNYNPDLPTIALSMEDFLIVNSSFDSYESLRHSEMGTFFIRAIIDVFSKHAAHRDLEDLMKQVRAKVKFACIAESKRRENSNLQGQVVTAESTLTKKLYLFPGL